MRIISLTMWVNLNSSSFKSLLSALKSANVKTTNQTSTAVVIQMKQQGVSEATVLQHKIPADSINCDGVDVHIMDVGAVGPRVFDYTLKDQQFLSHFINQVSCLFPYGSSDKDTLKLKLR